MNWTESRARFRAVLSGNRCVHPGSVFDPLSARIASSLGFEIGMFAGSVASLSVLGDPDITLITLTEFAEQAYRICRAGSPPLLVDADHGYGNALNVMRTVEELETAGVSGLTIEDTLLPRPFGDAKTSLISIDEEVAKLRAAVRARQDPGLVLVGRSQSAALSTLEDTIARVRAYQTTGVDALFVAGIKTRAQLEAVAEVATLPVILGNINADLADKEYLASKKVRIALQGHQPIMAAVQAAYNTLKALREGTPPSKLAGVAPAELMAQLTRDADFAAWTKDFLGG